MTSLNLLDYNVLIKKIIIINNKYKIKMIMINKYITEKASIWYSVSSCKRVVN